MLRFKTQGLFHFTSFNHLQFCSTGISKSTGTVSDQRQNNHKWAYSLKQMNWRRNSKINVNTNHYLHLVQRCILMFWHQFTVNKDNVKTMLSVVSVELTEVNSMILFLYVFSDYISFHHYHTHNIHAEKRERVSAYLASLTMVLQLELVLRKLLWLWKSQASNWATAGERQRETVCLNFHRKIINIR